MLLRILVRFLVLVAAVVLGVWGFYHLLKNAQVAQIPNSAPQLVSPSGTDRLKGVLAQLGSGTNASSQVVIPAADLKQLTAAMTAVQISVLAMQGEIQRLARDVAKQSELAALREQLAAMDRKQSDTFELLVEMVALAKNRPAPAPQPAAPAAPAPKRDVDVVPPTAQPNVATEKMVADVRTAIQKDIASLHAQHVELQKKLAPLEALAKMSQQLTALERNDRRLEKLDKLDKLDKFDPEKLERLARGVPEDQKKFYQEILEHLAALQRGVLLVAEHVARLLADESPP
jgi:hypothetical protein